MSATNLIIWGLVVHLVADWLLQNDWMAKNKGDLGHPAAYIHGGIHLLGSLLVFPVWAALFIAITHVLIDTRRPLEVWRRIYRQTTEGDNALLITLSFWQDQAAHIAILAIAALAVGR